MSKVRRIYVEKKKPFAAGAKEVFNEAKSYLDIKGLTDVRLLVRYDVENVSDDTFEKAVNGVFAELPVDDYYLNEFKAGKDDFVFSVEYLPGQFDQRADSAEQCISLLAEEEKAIVKTAETYIFTGKLTDEDRKKIKSHLINPVDQREASEEIPETLNTIFEEAPDVEFIEGFIHFTDEKLADKYNELGLAMTLADFKLIRGQYARIEKRDPSITEIRLFDTYWSDHCRHTTFGTELKSVKVEDGFYKGPFESAYRQYMRDHKKIYGERRDKYPSLMGMATLAMKKLKRIGKLDDLEESEEINACSIVIPVTIDGKKQEWLLNFKNETHNHPTEIEPFGGAATCLGGAIRDPLSGRTYVYQAMRITGAADPTRPVSETPEGKLPQRKIVTEAARGYSSYGNQIGLATGFVKEIYHPDFVAKHMELGAVLGAAPRDAVKRLTSDPGDIIVLLGGRTGRDGCGGATGSSKSHTASSIDVCGAEVQKGNAPTERKMQRLFRRPEVTSIIKKCNDFGAGGVSVAVGELADGLLIDLDKVTKKYEGLDGTELAISESQERMAVVLDPADVDAFLAFADEENLEATPIAEVTAEKRLVMNWRGKKIVDISRKFLDTNGAHQTADALITCPDENEFTLLTPEVDDWKKFWLSKISDINNCSQKGLVERFDSSIGAGTVNMPYGGKNKNCEIQAMIAKLPVLEGDCDTVSMMSYGYDPYLSSWSPFHGAAYAVTDSVAKIVASGGDYKKIRFSFQEYFGKMTEDPKRWGLPAAALLGAYEAQLGFGLPAIGGKDSMSGTFENIDVPPTLVSFAVNTAKEEDIITPELKGVGNYIMKFEVHKDNYGLPKYEQACMMYDDLRWAMQKGAIVSAYALDDTGIVNAVTRMAMGSGIGVKLDDRLTTRDIFNPTYGTLIVEVPADKVGFHFGRITMDKKILGVTTAEPEIAYQGQSISLEEAVKTWEAPLEDVYPTISKEGASVVNEKLDAELYRSEKIYICKNKTARPNVFIPVFPGTNCEYDLTRVFREAGADVDVRVFRNLTPEAIRESVESFKQAIDNAQIVMFPGGFSGGDEPDGSAKFFATAFRNAKLKESVEDLLNKRDGLVLGICNGFQALIKLGLVPDGSITGQTADSPTLTLNTIDRHISKMVNLKVTSNISPWLAGASMDEVYVNPASHGEGRFVAPDSVIKELIKNGQVATRYCDPEGNILMDEEFNVNGSYMAIEGITSRDGRVFGKMAHPERIGRSVSANIPGNHDMKIFESGVRYFK
ncbi:MAG: phosphoribosylformylglycinamidine synthase [Clostridiales bacterium]|nr:phosphoribosylformylglycinamidine synthase [Clostridiales bacterium]MBS5877856.1 phosphoribosylformylglycinamidine synthase [Clostridiales bacterium]